MSIFSSKKGKPREVDVGKAKQQQALAGNGARPQTNGQNSRNGTANAISNAALSAGARTIQRAQIMAASRKRMNSETPDYSIEGAAKGPAPRTASIPSSISLSAARQAAQGSKNNAGVEPKSRLVDNPHKLTKTQRPSNDAKKSRTNSINNVAQNGTVTPIYAALQTTNSPQPSPNLNDTSNVGTPPNGFMIQKTPPLPQDSPTLGYDGSFTKPPPPTTSRAGSATPSFKSSMQTQMQTQKQGGISTPQEIRVGRLSRNDSGLSKTASREDGSHESQASKSSSLGEKPASVPPGMRAEEKTSGRSSRSSMYVSKLDPGPTRSSFAEPMESSKIEDLFNGDDVKKRPRQTSRPQKFQGLDMDVRKEPSSGAMEKPPQPSEASAPKDAGSRGLNRIVAASQAVPIPQTNSSAPQSRKEERPFVEQPRSSTPPLGKPRGIESKQEATAKPPILPISPAANTEGFRTAPTSTTISPAVSSDSQHRNTGSTDSQAKAPAPDSYFSNTAAAAPAVQPFVPISIFATQPDPRSSSSSERRPTLPPVSVLEGFKVNKRGHVLDEEGEVVGELFEGDLIDCVRQKVDASGDVLDESGVSVGRVRTVVKGSISAPRWSISSGTSLPLSTYNWGRRDSTASQQTHNTHHTHQGHAPTFFNRPSVSHVVAPPVEGNTFVAELDASNEAEAGPVLDQSEIFSPFAAPKGPDSSTSTTNRSELAADERRASQSPKASPKSESRRESVVAEERPVPPKPVRKWTSRYFESSPIEGQLARRNSATPDMVQSPVEEKLASPRTTSVVYGAVSRKTSRAVIGPTLESLMEQDPSLFSEQRSFGGSTPNLPLTGTKSGSSTPRPTSTQYGPPAPGLGHRLSSYGGHQPMRRSPLGNYEITPPGSGPGNVEDDKTRSRSVPPAPRTNSKKASKLSMEAEDAAPAPEISRKKWQEKRALLSVPLPEKTLEKRKSRFSFMMGKKE